MLFAMSLVWFACTPKSLEDSGTTEGDPTLEWSSPEDWGPLGVGALTLEWVDARGKEMLAEVWYPARPDADAVAEPYPPLGLSGQAIRSADADTRFGPYPMVAFSHGYGGIRFQSIYLTEFLASHGFVVVSPQHRYNTFLDMDDDHLLDITVQRPGDVMESVDELLRRSATPDDRLNGLVQDDRYAIVGHSFGAFTSMIVGGGDLDIDGVVGRCETSGGSLCGIIDELTDELIASHRMTDPRAVVTVPLAPGVWYAFGPDGVSAPGLESVRQPLVLGGDADPVLDYGEEIHPCYENMASPKTFVNFHDAGHYAFSNMCDLAPFITDECEGVDGGWADVAEVQRLSRTIVLAHIRQQMRGEVLDQPYTAAEWLSDTPGVTVEQE
jgi:predicted dienelactone hydrolase